MHGQRLPCGADDVTSVALEASTGHMFGLHVASCIATLAGAEVTLEAMPHP